MSSDVEIDAWLRERGFGLAAVKPQARACLESAGLTRAGKTRMSVEKLPAAQEALGATFALHCSSVACVGWAKTSGRTAVPCEQKAQCEHCGGSENQRATADFIAACKRAGVTRVLIVGGSPSTREELERLVGTAVSLRLVDGSAPQGRPIERAKADLEWAQLVLLWGASELHHKVSMQYTNAEPAKRDKIVHVTKRGIAQLLGAAVVSLS